MTGAGPGGFDQVVVPDGQGGTRTYTRAEFEELPLADRVRFLMNAKTQFYRKGVLITARDALHDR
jgi:hypothetical protein